MAKEGYTLGIPRKRLFLNDMGDPEQGYRISVTLDNGAIGYVDIPVNLVGTPAGETIIHKEVERLKKLSGA